MTQTVHLITDDAFLHHETGPGHPECPERLRAIRAALDKSNNVALRWRTPEPATDDAVRAVHDTEYIAHLKSCDGRHVLLDADTTLSPGSIGAAWLAAGAAITAVRAVSDHPGDRAFALVRPPGHHAEASQAMGFCLLNNIAIAAAHAIDTLGHNRVMVVDWDVHHGNGTQHIFESRDDVLVVSSHRSHFYPGTGRIDETGTGRGRGYTVNLPLPPGLDDATHVALYERLLPQLAAWYQPDLILVSAGFDSHGRDPLGGMRMTAAGFGVLTSIVADIADRHANGRLALILEGGYALDALAASVVECCRVLAGGVPEPIAAADPAALRLVTDLADHHLAHRPNR